MDILLDIVNVGMMKTKEIKWKERYLEGYLPGIMKWNSLKVIRKSVINIKR